MINTYIVSGMVRMLSKTSEAIETLVQTNIQVPFDSFEEMLLDELHHLQILTLELTKVLTGTVEEKEGDNASETE